MIRTLLFDLDNTLLDNEMSTFIPEFMRLYTNHVAAVTSPERFASELLVGTRAMADNTDPARTLEEVFSSVFFPALGLSAETFRANIDDFYAGPYRALEAVVGRRPIAREVMEWAFSSGFEVVIATNPLFPLAALQQRLAWAGVEDYPYTLVTSPERMHFAKPNPAYFAEVLGLVGRRADQALVIGNDWRNDIHAAHQAGIAAFWIASRSTKPPEPSPGLVGQGDLGDFLAWARDDDCIQRVISLPVTPTALKAHLLAMPAVASAAVAGVNADQWRERPDPAAWSLVEILCHLRDSEREVNLKRVERFLSEDTPFISAENPDAWAEERDYRNEDGEAALAAYRTARQQTLARLGELAPADWDRRARHAIFGPTTLSEIVSIWIDHDRVHMAQLRDTRASVAPWPG
ncbi:MAG: DinB family protein [Anaerolineales bacterium]